MPRSYLTLVVIALLAFTSGSVLRAQAQAASPYTTDETQQTTGETVVLPAFTVESETVDRYRAADAVSAVRIRTQLIETPSSISVLTRDFMEDVAPVRVHDAAKYIAGVQDGSGNTYGDVMVIRGFPTFGRNVDNFRDGLAYNYDDALAGSDRFAYRLIGAYQDTGRYWSSSARLRNKLIAPQFTWRISPTTELVTRYHYFENHVFREPALIIDSSVVERGQEPILGPGFSYKGLNGTPPWSGLHFTVHNIQFQLSTSFNKYLTMRLAGVFRRYDEGSVQAFLFPSGTMANRYNPYTGVATPDQVWALADPSLPHHAISNPYQSTNSAYYDPTAVPLRGEKIIDNWYEGYEVQNDWVFSLDTSYAKAGFAYFHSLWIDKRVNGSLAPINLFDLANQDSTPTWDTTFSRDRDIENTSGQLYLNQRVSFWGDRIALTGGYLKYDTEAKLWDKATINPEELLDESKDMYMASALVRVASNASLYYSYSTNATPAIINF